MGLRDAFIYDIAFCWFVNRNIAINNDMCYCWLLYPFSISLNQYLFENHLHNWKYWSIYSQILFLNIRFMMEEIVIILIAWFKAHVIKQKLLTERVKKETSGNFLQLYFILLITVDLFVFSIFTLNWDVRKAKQCISNSIDL